MNKNCIGNTRVRNVLKISNIYRYKNQDLKQLQTTVPEYVITTADPSGRVVYGVRLRPLACWDVGFESRLKHGHLCLESVECCKVEVSASGWLLMKRSPTERVRLSVIVKPRQWDPEQLITDATWKKIVILSSIWFIFSLDTFKESDGKLRRTILTLESALHIIPKKKY
jgi:hypothetical protein